MATQTGGKQQGIVEETSPTSFKPQCTRSCRKNSGVRRAFEQRIEVTTTGSGQSLRRLIIMPHWALGIRG